MTDITDLAGPIVGRFGKELLAAGAGFFIPTLSEGEDSIVVVLMDAGEVKSLESTVHRVLKKAGIRGAQVWWLENVPEGIYPTLLATFPISTNTITRLSAGDC